MVAAYIQPKGHKGEAGLGIDIMRIDRIEKDAEGLDEVLIEQVSLIAGKCSHRWLIYILSISFIPRNSLLFEQRSNRIPGATRKHRPLV